MTRWWRVQPPIDAEFLVLVVNGRVVVRTGVGKFFVGVGERWDETRMTLERAQFTCTMESSP